MPADSPERATRTRRFQQINDAYYTLSDPTRRREYDATGSNFGFGFGGGGGSGSGRSSAPPEDADEEIPRPEAGSSNPFGSFPWSAFGFGGQAKNEGEREQHSNEQFGSVFEEMLRYVLRDTGVTPISPLILMLLAQG